MLIILEGPDGAGKSTLAEQLAAKAKSKIVHHGPYLDIKDPAELARKYLDSMAPALAGENLVLDRSWLSEPIYGAVYREGRSRIWRSHQRMLERCARACGAVVVVCLPPLKRCEEAFMDRRKEEYLDNLKQLRAVYHGYESALEPTLTFRERWTDLATVTYDYTEEDHWEEAFGWTKPVPKGMPGGGAWNPGRSILIVGDRANKARHDDPTRRVPFVAFDGVGCSNWLAEQLEVAEVGEDRLYWVNAYDGDGVPTDKAFLDELKPQKILCLGRRATGWLGDYALGEKRFVELPHPQHHKRFYNGRPYKIIEVLRK